MLVNHTNQDMHNQTKKIIIALILLFIVTAQLSANMGIFVPTGDGNGVYTDFSTGTTTTVTSTGIDGGFITNTY
jgi:flagellar basal body-associated protein FliL